MTRLTIDQAVPDLASHWLAHYRMAIQEGLGARPSGAWTRDPHCAAAAVLTTANVSSFWPQSYGGTGVYTRNQARWSATRRACLATFEHGIRMGLAAPQAARAMRKARLLGRARLGIHPDDTIKIERWLAMTEKEKQDHRLSIEREERWKKLLRAAQMTRHHGYISFWPMMEWRGNVMTDDEHDLRVKNVAKVLSELIGAASW